MNIKQHINRFLFACGVPQSGTTLLQRMLNSHPELAVANDTHFIPRALELTDESLVEAARAGSLIPLTLDLAGNLDQYHRFHSLEISPQEFNATVRVSDNVGAFPVSDLSAQLKRPV